MATILVIDGNPRNRTQVERILRLRTDHTVILAQDGAEAFEHLQKGLPDLILMDLFLPRIDGFHLYKVLKEQAATARIPIILSTSVHLDAITEAKVSQLRLEGRVEMPVSSVELIETISLVLLRQKEVRQIRREQIEGGPQGVARVIWPRVEGPAPPQEVGPPPVTPKDVKPVVWPKAGSREDRRMQGAGAPSASEGDQVPPWALPKPSGRELRARLAMLASGKEKAEGGRREAEEKSKVQSPKSKVQSQRPDPGLRTQDSSDQTRAERAQALLRYVGKPSTPPDPKTKGFQSIPLAQADPARVVDFTKKRKGKNAPSKEGKNAPSEDRKNRSGATEKKEQDPVIRSVQWTQIKKKE